MIRLGPDRWHPEYEPEPTIEKDGYDETSLVLAEGWARLHPLPTNAELARLIDRLLFLRPSVMGPEFHDCIQRGRCWRGCPGFTVWLARILGQLSEKP